MRDLRNGRLRVGDRFPTLSLISDDDLLFDPGFLVLRSLFLRSDCPSRYLQKSDMDAQRSVRSGDVLATGSEHGYGGSLPNDVLLGISHVPARNGRPLECFDCHSFALNRRRAVSTSPR